MTTINVNLYAISGTVSGWNNVNGHATTGERIADMVDDAAASTGISFNLDTAFTQSTTWGSLPTTDPHGFPDAAYGDFWYLNGTPRITLSGFDASQTGTIDFMCHSSNSARDTDIAISGDSGRYDSNGSLTLPAAPLQLSFTATGGGDVVIDPTVVSVFAYMAFFQIVYTAGPAGGTGAKNPFFPRNPLVGAIS